MGLLVAFNNGGSSQAQENGGDGKEETDHIKQQQDTKDILRNPFSPSGFSRFLPCDLVGPLLFSKLVFPAE